MNYWWVNQTDNWQDEFETGYLYSGESNHAYRKSILKTRKGDVVICTHGSGRKRKIYAIGMIAEGPKSTIVARRTTRTAQSPKKDKWLRGWEVKIDYLQLQSPASWQPIWSAIRETHEAKHFNKKRSGVQGYLFPVPTEQPRPFWTSRTPSNSRVTASRYPTQVQAISGKR